MSEWGAAAAGFSIISMMDAFNCILRGHDDWWAPTLLAFIAAACIRRATQESRE